MIVIENYLRKANIKGGVNGRLLETKDFFSLENDKLVQDNVEWFKDGHLMYIPGALIISVNGLRVLDFKDWDYPYWIYGQLCDFLDEINAGKGFKLPYLESDSCIDVTPLNRELCLLSYLSNGNVLSRIDCKKNDLYKAFLNGALQAFRIVDEHRGKNSSKDISALESCLTKLASTPE